MLVSEHLFLYGTLLPDTAPPEIAEAVAQLRVVAQASVPGLLFDLGEFPGAVLDGARGRRVHGALFELPRDSAVLSALDAYEEFSAEFAAESLFLRRRATARLTDGNECECWIYLYNRETSAAQVIESGFWKPRLAQEVESRTADHP